MPPTLTLEDSKPVTWLSLPRKPQLFILALCRLSEPLSNTCLLPYLYYLIRSLHAPGTSTPASISRQAGLLVSLFALSQFATSLPWASVANHWGRRPSIVLGLVLSIISNIGFGFSRSIAAVMCWRVLAGVGNGNIGVMRTMTAEIVKERKYQSRAFLLLPLVFNSGNVIGLALGGCLADPVANLAWLFGPSGVLNLASDPEGVAWMRKFPFALPTLFNAGVLTCSLVLSVCGLEETIPGRAGEKDVGLMLGDALKKFLKRIFLRKRSGYAVINTDDGDDTSLSLSLDDIPTLPSPDTNNVKGEIPKTTFSITSRSIYTREVLCTITSFALLPIHNAAFMQLFPVFLSTPPSDTPATSPFAFNGGLGLASSKIGLFLSAFSIYGILIQLFIYPALQVSLGTLWSYRFALSIFPFAYILAPYLALIPSSHGVIQSLGIVCILWMQVTARTFGIPSSVILLTNSSPNPAALGAVHGVGNMMNALARAVGPMVGGLIFGFGLEQGIVGTVWWAYLTVFSVLGLAWTWALKKGEKRGVQLSEISGQVELESQRFRDDVGTEEEKPCCNTRQI